LWIGCAQLALAGLAMVAGSDCALGQTEPPEHRIFTIDTIIQGQSSAISRAYGISNNGWVVGESTATAAPGSKKHAFLWVFNELGPTFPARTTKDVHALSGLTSTLESIGHDVNINNMIVGRKGGIADPLAIRFIVSSTGASATAIDVGVLGGGSFSTAWAINDTDALGLTTIVGESQIGTNCIGGGGKQTRGIRLVIGGTMGLVVLNVFGDPHQKCGAYEVNNDLDSDPNPDMVGYSGTCLFSGQLCLGPDDAAHWSGPGDALEIDDLFELGQHAALGMNDADMIVGYGWVDYDPSPGTLCVQEATWWQSALHGPVNLGDVTGIDLEDITFANAITEPFDSSKLVVVGRNESDGVAFRWKYDGSSWTAGDLNLTLFDTDATTDVDPCGWDRLFEATDVNDIRWIVGFGDRFPVTAGDQVRGFLVVPALPCGADFNGDCFVDGGDLGQLLLHWAPCPSGIDCFACSLASTCPWDLNCDGTVNGADIGQLQLHFDDDFPCGPECTGIDCTGGSFAGGGEGGSSAASGGGEGSIPNLSEIIAELVESGDVDLVVWLLDVLGNPNQ
jgi:probable HAF family extracellular repeat protein